MTMLRHLVIVGLLAGASVSAQSGNLGIFTHVGDVGGPALKGSTVYDPATREYRITGAGINMWAKEDQFQYVWREITGNFTATATVRFIGESKQGHRKAGIVVRQSLDTDATYADVVVHGDGMPALQWRSRKGENTNTFNLPFDGPGTFTVKLVRDGIRVTMFVGKNGAEPKETVRTEVSFQGPVLVGIGVCSHDGNVLETAIFSNVSIDVAPAAPPAGS